MPKKSLAAVLTLLALSLAACSTCPQMRGGVACADGTCLVAQR